MAGYVQASARVPEEGRPVLLEIAAQMRGDSSFIEKAAAWIAAERAGDELADWRAEIERRLEALETESRKDAYEALHPETRYGAIGNDRKSSRQVGDSTASADEVNVNNVNVDQVGDDRPVRPTGTGEVASGRPKSVPGENTFQPTAADIGLTRDERQVDIEDLLKPVSSGPVEQADIEDAETLRTTWWRGEGRGKKLTEAGEVEFNRLIAKGVGNGDIARRMKMTRQSADTRRKKLEARG